MKKIVAVILALILAVPAIAEEAEEPNALYVMVEELNGRIRAGKKYSAITTFSLGTVLKPTGRMSEDHGWVEIQTPEGELVWCHVDYLSERQEIIHVYTLWEEGVRIRAKPGKGRVTGIARKDQILEITQIVLGYGKCSRGWVDLSYFIEECE